MTLSVYSKQQMLLHWVSAAVILWTLVTGFYVANVNVAMTPNSGWPGSMCR